MIRKPKGGKQWERESTASVFTPTLFARTGGIKIHFIDGLPRVDIPYLEKLLKGSFD
jgi:hypothetical protein